MRPASEPAAPGSGCTLSFAAVYDEVEVLAERARAHGGGRVDGPADTPWNTRDLTTADPDGNTVIFTAARPPRLADTAFSEQMRQRSRQQSLDPDSRLPPCLLAGIGAHDGALLTAVSGSCPRAAWETGILGLGKPCERPKSAAGGRSVVPRGF